MILVADSGSSKTQWILVKSVGSHNEFETIGLNPFYVPSEQMVYEIQNALTPEWCVPQVSEVFFYGSGCASGETEQIVAKALSAIFSNADISVYSDILGAARALYKDQPGIAVILGTGASSCDYDGAEVIERIPALGYILGDEGSGAVLGMTLLKAYLHHKLPEKLHNLFSVQYKLDIEDLKSRVYSGDRPNRFLASYTRFLSENMAHPFIQSMVASSFKEMFQTQVCRYRNWEQKEVRMLGSVAYYFSDILRELAMQNHVRLTRILQSPIHELAHYHASSFGNQRP